MERTSKRMCEKESNWLTTVQALQSMKTIFQLLIELNRQELKLNPMNETCHYHPGRPLRTSYTLRITWSHITVVCLREHITEIDGGKRGS